MNLHRKKLHWLAIVVATIAYSLFLVVLVPGTALACHIEAQYSGTLLTGAEDDFVNGTTKSVYHLRVPKKGRRPEQTYKLEFDSGFPGNLKSGYKVKVRGRRVHGTTILKVGPGKVTVTDTSSMVTAAATGSHSVLVLRVTSLNGANTVSPSCSASQIGTVMQNVSDLNSEASYGKFGYSPITSADVSINLDTSSCNYTQVASAANSAYGSVSGFTHVVYVFVGSCGWSGLAYMPGSQAWIKGSSCSMMDVYAHELGHNIAMHHGSTDANNDGVIDSEYGDTSTYMGYAGYGYRHPNGPNKVQMGWATPITVNAPGGDYNLNALEISDTSSVLKVITSAGAPYYLAFRARLGSYSTGLPSGDQNRTAVIRYGGGSVQTRKITTLGNGASFLDSAEGITFTQLSSTSSSAVVRVDWGCSVNAPAVTITPAVQVTNAAGTQLDYIVSVKNNDSLGCGNSTSFSVASAVPAGWQAAGLDSASMTLAAGQTGQTGLHMVSPAGSADADYGVTVTASASEHANVSGNAVYRIDQSPPSTPTNLVASSRKKGRSVLVSLTWSASSDASGMASYNVYRQAPNGALTQLPSVTYNSASDTIKSSNPSGMYSYWVTAVDSAGNQSAASNSASVTK